MANREKGEIGLTVKGKTYTLVMNTNVMATLEEHFSSPDNEVTWDVIWTRILRGSVRTVRALIWAMLQQHHPQITLEGAAQVIDDAGGFEGMTKLLKQVGKQSTPDPTDVKELDLKRPRKAARRGTGGTSTSTRDASA